MIKKSVKSLLICLVIFCGLFFFLLSNQIGGWRGFNVSSASMEPTIMTGSLILTQSVQPAALKPGDIITFISPTKERQFITHRVNKIMYKNNSLSFKTKGDNNHTEDNWILAGGGVVGKVMLTVPYVGYLLNFSQTKIGILLFILIPALWILYDEILQILTLLSRRKPVSAFSHETLPVFLLIVIGLVSSSNVLVSYALLNDQVTLTGNTFTVASIMPSPTMTTNPSPGTCGGNTTINISRNGAGSSNSVQVDNNCSQNSITQMSETRVTNMVNTSTTTGNNKTEFNSVNSLLQDNKSTTINTGNIQTNISVTVDGTTNVKITN